MSYLSDCTLTMPTTTSSSGIVLTETCKLLYRPVCSPCKFYSLPRSHCHRDKNVFGISNFLSLWCLATSIRCQCRARLLGEALSTNPKALPCQVVISTSRVVSDPKHWSPLPRSVEHRPTNLDALCAGNVECLGNFKHAAAFALRTIEYVTH